MVALERVIEESNAKEQTGSVEVADDLFYAFSFYRQRVASCQI